MFTRILLVSATAVALTVPAAQSAQLFPSFALCKFAPTTQCASQLTRGNGNKARIDQSTTTFGSLQLAGQGQDGNNNRAYTGQNGSNQVALTIQDGNNNGSFTHQEGAFQASVTVQTGNGNWAGTSSIGTGTATLIVQQNN